MAASHKCCLCSLAETWPRAVTRRGGKALGNVLTEPRLHIESGIESCVRWWSCHDYRQTCQMYGLTDRSDLGWRQCGNAAKWDQTRWKECTGVYDKRKGFDIYMKLLGTIGRYSSSLYFAKEGASDPCRDTGVSGCNARQTRTPPIMEQLLGAYQD